LGRKHESERCHSKRTVSKIGLGKKIHKKPFETLSHGVNYEHIVRNEKELNLIREYIQNNPLQWHLDWENPLRTGGMEPLEDEIFGNTT
jgi:hypothetical protein